MAKTDGREEVLVRFLSDTKDHTLEIKLDSGLYRHLHLSRNGSSVYAYGIVTWPGHLAIYGDMGDLVFQRLEDMLMFFRGDHNELIINPSYWHEKLQARDKTEEFDPDAFEEYLAEARHEDPEFLEGAEDVMDGFMVGTDATTYIYENAKDLYTSELPSFSRYTFHYLWKLYAIVHAIKLYDDAKKAILNKETT